MTFYYDITRIVVNLITAAVQSWNPFFLDSGKDWTFELKWKTVYGK